MPLRAPRDRVRVAALKATTELLDELALDNFSMDDVSERSGLSKSTLYRWWPSKGALAFDAFQEKIRELAASMDQFMPYENRGGAYDELLSQVEGMVHLLSVTQTGRTLADLIAEGRRDERVLESFRTDFLMPRRVRSRSIVSRELQRLQQPDAVDPDIVLDLLYGAIYFRLLVRHAPLDKDFAHEVVDFVMAGLAGSAVKRSERHDPSGTSPLSETEAGDQIP
jgi:AcrR family transcriptional regulator